MRRDIDQQIAAFAANQCGAVKRSQVYSSGGDRRLVDRRLANGMLVEVSENVLLVPSHPSSWRQSLWLAILDSEDGAVVSHESAARVHRIDTFAHERSVVLTVPHGDRRTELTSRVHQTRHPPEPIVIDGLPVTSVTRTIVDLGRVLRAGRLEAIVDDALRRRVVRTGALWDEWVAAYHRWPWRLRTLGEILASRGPGYRPPRSVLEKAFRELLVGMPGITFEAPFPGADRPESCVDALAQPERVVLESDGRDFHTKRQDFVRDRERDRAAYRAGFITARYVHSEVVGDPEGVRAEIEAIRAQRRRDLGLAA